MSPQEALQEHGLIHQPYGEQHPYEPLPWEREPRDPCAGEVVKLGAATSQHQPAESVWCDWREVGSPEVNRAEAVRCGAGEGMDYWQAVLPPFKGGEKITYRFFAQSGGAQVQSDEFEFTVRTWVEAAAISAIEDRADRLVVLFETTRPGFFLRLTAQSDKENTISLQLAAAHQLTAGISRFTDQSPLVKKWGNAALSLDGSPPRLTLTRAKDGLTLRGGQPIRALVGEDGKVFSYQVGFESPADEAFYGFGERFNALDQRGSRLDNRVFGQYTSQGKRTYIPIPFFLSSRGYGVWLNTDCQAYFDLAAGEANRWNLEGQVEDGASLEMRFFFQAHPRDIVTAFTDLTGKPQLPPPWVFGLWMSGNDWNSQAEVLRQLQLTQLHGIPASVMVIEAWSDETTYYVWNDARYKLRPAAQAYLTQDYQMPADGLWPDPKGMADQLHRAGVRLVLWQIPVLKCKYPHERYDTAQADADQAYALQQAYAVRKADGQPHRIEAHAPWFPNSLVFDFSSPEAEEWWFRQREYLLAEIGVDGFKTDGGEHIWDGETRFWNGLRGNRGINLYPLMYEAAYNRFMKKHRGDDYVLFSRAGYTGAQQVSCHWAGDERSTWEAYRASMRAMLNAGLCGIAFIGWDIAGFSGPLPGSDLYLRAAAFSAFCPIMQYHSEFNARQTPSRDRTPWNIQAQTGDQTVIPIFQKFANLRMNLIPYVISQAHVSHQTGLPMMRALPLEYPRDKKCREYPYEYMFGDGLLVAPVVEEGRTSWPVYLPEGEWYDLWSFEILAGGRELTPDVPLDQIPVFVRKGSIVPLNLDDSLGLCSPVGNSTEEIKNLAALVFPGGAAHMEVYQGAGRPTFDIFSRAGHNGGVSIEIDRAAPDIDLLIIGNLPRQVNVDGAPIPPLEPGCDGEGSFWTRHTAGGLTRVHVEKDQKSRVVVSVIA